LSYRGGPPTVVHEVMSGPMGPGRHAAECWVVRRDGMNSVRHATTTVTEHQVKQVEPNAARRVPVAS
jgi:hypothetical protein